MKILYVICLLGGSALAFAQIPIAPGSIYTQNFDILANSGSSRVPWIDNNTLTGWYAYGSNEAIINYGVSTGPEGGGIASLGLDGATDRALGTGLNLTTGSYIYFGAQFTNSSINTIENFTISYDGEQWFRSSSGPTGGDTLTFGYQIFNGGNGSLTANTGWVNVNALTFTSPNNINGSFTSLNGNLEQNRVANINSSLTGVSIAPGQELWIRWTATNLAGFSDHTLAVDNLSVNFGTIPEPASISTMAGLLVLAAVANRRQRRAVVPTLTGMNSKQSQAIR